MKKYWFIFLLGLSLPVSAGEGIIDLGRVFYDEIVKEYGRDWAGWIMEYPTHPPVDVSGPEPKIHNGNTATWRTYDPKRAEWACLFRIDADGEIRGRYLYDNRIKPMPVYGDSIIVLIKKDISLTKEKK